MSQLAWNDINWKLIQKRFSRQQRRVYRASIDGNNKKVHALQRRIIRSLDAKLIAIKYVIDDNIFNNHTSVNNIVSISDKKKIKLANSLQFNRKTNSTNQVYNAKFRKSESQIRPIIIIEDRARQMMAKLVLEPEWEAMFEPNSYGWRPTKSQRAAITSIFRALKKRFTHSD